MANFQATGTLVFSASDSGTNLVANSPLFDDPSANTVFDFNADDDVDTVDYYIATGFQYSGYTMRINGNDYAVFFNSGANLYGVPYNSALDDLSALNGSAVTQTITQTGENAVVVNCYLTGTLIATPQGERAIETLGPGDLVTLADGNTAPVRWVARQEVRAKAVNLSLPADRLPIRIDAGALGHGVPHTDVTVSAGHGMMLDGMIVNAAALVNGTSIRFLSARDMPERFTYWHIELDHHAVLLANGAPSESLVDYSARSTYDNYAEYLHLHGAERMIPEMALPRVSARRHVPAALRARLNGSSQPERMAG